MLWRVAKSDVYLLGCIHFMNAEPVFFSRAVSAYKDARRVVVEADNSGQRDQSLIHLPPGKRLSHLIPLPLFGTLCRQWAEAKLPEDELEQCSPWWAGFRLGLTLAVSRGARSEWGIDGYVQASANTEGKPVFYLEDVNAGWRAFAAGPVEEQVKTLVHMSGEVFQTELVGMMAAWRARDQLFMERLLDHRYQNIPVTAEKLTADRNRAWLPHLRRLISDGEPTLVAVGALHLVGRAGVPALLSDVGLTTERVDD
jgi:uncharacterized protein YbaP (TraB family)